MGGASDAEVREALGSGLPKHPLHKIVCIGALVASRQPEAGWSMRSAPPTLASDPRLNWSETSSRGSVSCDHSSSPSMATASIYRFCGIGPWWIGSLPAVCKCGNTFTVDWSEAQIRDFIANRKTDNPHLRLAMGIANSGALDPRYAP